MTTAPHFNPQEIKTVQAAAPKAPVVTPSVFDEDPADTYIAVNLRAGAVDADLSPEDALRLSEDLRVTALSLLGGTASA